jgi:hypothetical protein
MDTLVAFAFKEAQEFLANFRTSRHHYLLYRILCSTIGVRPTKGSTAKDAEDAKIGCTFEYRLNRVREVFVKAQRRTRDIDYLDAMT